VLAMSGGGRLWEFFFLKSISVFPEIGGPNSTCLQDVLSLQYEASLGIPAIVRGVHNSNTQKNRAPVCTIEHGAATVDFGLAAFLVAAGEYGWRLRERLAAAKLHSSGLRPGRAARVRALRAVQEAARPAARPRDAQRHAVDKAVSVRQRVVRRGAGAQGEHR